MNKKRIMVVDDHTSVRTMLEIILASDPEYEIAGGTSSGMAAVSLCAKIKPDLVILDLMLPELNGMEILRKLRAADPQICVVIYSGSTNRELITEVLKHRPNAFVEKGDSLESLLKAIRITTAGGNFFAPIATALLPGGLPQSRTGKPSSGLTEREREVLQLVAEGLTNKAIAERLRVSVKTVENHRAHLMEKLNLHDTAGLTRYAVRNGLVSLE